MEWARDAAEVEAEADVNMSGQPSEDPHRFLTYTVRPPDAFSIEVLVQSRSQFPST